jgi:hypothetical protein
LRCGAGHAGSIEGIMRGGDRDPKGGEDIEKVQVSDEDETFGIPGSCFVRMIVDDTSALPPVSTSATPECYRSRVTERGSFKLLTDV